MTFCPPKIHVKWVVWSLTVKKENEKRKKKEKEKFLVLYYQSVSVILFLAPRKCWGWDMKKLECDLWYTTFPVNT